MQDPLSGAPFADAIAGGHHSDAFSVLGPHEVSPGVWQIRAWLPHADSAEAIFDGMIAMPMTRVHPRGLWVATLDQAPGRYRFRLQSGTHEWEEDDPYRFPPQLTAFQLHLHAEGTHYETYNTLGAHFVECQGVRGVRFAVWAPNAIVVSVVGDFNGWDSTRHPMRARDGGIWEVFIPGVGLGAIYKYFIHSRVDS
ncbi:MAG: 1,4-alpha-glucan branching enzyme, partial [Bryobacteraceae bacterium]